MNKGKDKVADELLRMRYRKSRNNLRRRAEEVAYWRNRAGWYDDDATINAYNGVNYQHDDDYSRGGSRDSSTGNAAFMNKVLTSLAILVSFGIILLLFRAISRRQGGEKSKKKDKNKKSSSDKARRGRSKSRSRSQSRSGKKRAGDYDLMDDKERSSRSRSKSKRRSSRSRSRKRSPTRSRPRSRSARRSSEKAAPPIKGPVLV